MAKKKETEKAPKKELKIYIGRNVHGLNRYTVFRDSELPEYIKALIAKQPAIANLIIPVSRLQESKKLILEKGSALYHFNSQLNKR